MFTALLGQAGVWGRYVAIWKVLLFLIFLGFWAWVGQWLDKDAPMVRTNRSFWNNLYVGTGAGALLLWFLLPAPFVVNCLLFLATWATVSITYVMHRNARVPKDLRIFTQEHIREMLSRKGRQPVQARLKFISANRNDLPVPQKHEIEYQGWIVAEDLLHQLCTQRVSRAELVPMGDEYQLAYVIDGVAGHAGERSRLEVERAVAYLKAVAGLEVEDRRRPQTGTFTVEMDKDDFPWRASTSGSTRGEQMVLERLEEARLVRLDALGFDPSQLEVMQQVIKAPAGIVLVTGPPGSGLTTTLYAVVKQHDAFIQNINTLEKKLLRSLDNVTQHLVGEKGTADPARQLQSILRGDPDVVIVGFCDTAEIAQAGTRGALEGKKLYFGINEPSAFHALQTWLRLVGDHEKAVRTLLAITCQRVVRKLCSECRVAYAPDATLLKKLNLPADRIKQFYRAGEVEYDKRGNPIRCEKCQGTGYFERMAVFEMLIISDSLRQLLRENAPISAIRAQARNEKMMFLQELALRKVIDGATSIQEMLRVTTDRPAGPPAPAASPAGQDAKG